MKNPYLKTELKYFLHTFWRQPILVQKARGSRVWDENGRRYFDFFSGLAVCGVGHNNDAVVRAVRRQAGRVLHTSNYFYTQPQMRLAEALTKRVPGSRVFFSNSGAEANELAIKLARLWATHQKKPGREIVTFRNAFHGRTLATSAASAWGRDANRFFQPTPRGFKSVPFNDLGRAIKAIGRKTIAVMIEPVQGEGGINIAARPFLRGLAAACRRKNVLLIADEIQSGMGRTGRFLAVENARVKPDIVTLAKGLAGGLPLGATLVQKSIASLVQPGLHGSTFGGNPVACAASLEVLKLLTPSALRTIRETSEHLKVRLAAFKKFKSVADVRGVGLLLAIELNRDGAAYVAAARERGLLINCTQGKVLRFLPPYFMTRRESETCLRILESVFIDLG